MYDSYHRVPNKRYYGLHAGKLERLQRDVTVTKIATADNLTDPFTKALPQKVFERHVDSLGLRCSVNEL